MISLQQLEIGFEFEFLFHSKILKQAIKNDYKEYTNKNTVTNQAYHEGIETFLTAMEKYNPHVNWIDICMPRQDLTIQSLNHKEYFGIEIATKQQNGEFAMSILDDILTVLSKAPFKSNDTCGMHFNASFKNKMPKGATLAFYTAKNLDLHAINKRFKRDKNEHCEPNFNDKISREEMGVLLFDTLFQGERGHSYYTNYAMFEKKISELMSKEKLTNFITLIKENIIDDATHSWDVERPAIAHKQYEGKEYLEYRSMGGKNYPNKKELILNSINEFLEAMFKAREMIFKDKTLQTRKYKT